MGTGGGDGVSTNPYVSAEKARVCMDEDMWQVWVWDGTRNGACGFPHLEEVGSAEMWCARYVEESYGPLSWYRLEPVEGPV